MLLRTCYLSAAQFSKSQVDKTLCTNSIGIFCIAKKICGSSAQILPLAKADALSADCAQLPQNRQYTKRCALTALNYPALRKTSAGIAQVKAYASNAVRAHLPENKKNTAQTVSNRSALCVRAPAQLARGTKYVYKGEKHTRGKMKIYIKRRGSGGSASLAPGAGGAGDIPRSLNMPANF